MYDERRAGAAKNVGMTVPAMLADGKADNVRTGCDRPRHADWRVFDDQCSSDIETDSVRRMQINVGRGLTACDVLAA